MKCICKAGSKPVQLITRDAAAANITTSYTTLLDPVPQDVNAVRIETTVTSQSIFLGIGLAASEQDVVVIRAVTSGVGPFIPVFIPKGSRLAVKAVGTISSGLVYFSLMQ